VNPAELPLPERLIRMQGLLGSTVHPFVWITTNDAAATSITNSTNQIITVLLVRSSDPNVLVEAKAQRGRDPNQPLPTVRLRLTSVGTNLITGKSDAVAFTLQNTFGSDYQNLLLSNRVSVNTYQPTNFLMFKQTFADVVNPFGGLASVDTQRILVEVERTQKESSRLKHIMMANLRTKNITGCHYWTTDALYPVIQSHIKMLENDLQSKMQIFLLPNEVKL
jgi:hypothetical protein